jgi:hypothetical protein
MISFTEFMSTQKSQSTKEIDLAKESDLIKESIQKAIEEKKEEKINESNLVNEDNHKKEEIIESVEVAPVGYKIFRDKSENFICDMEISGANPANSKARIIIESKDLTYMFEGTIDAQGKCKIPLKKMNFLGENETGIIKLEVIADDTVFTPWEDNFVAVNSKRVEVKVYESTTDNESKIGVRLKSIR